MTVPQPEIDLLKRTVDLVALVTARGIRLTPRGKDLVGLCPFHSDTTPSLIVTPGKNLWHCFSCGAGGDVIEFVRRTDGVDFPEAVRRVREFGPRLSERAAEGKEPSATDERDESAFSPSAALLFDSVLSHYRRSLKNDPAALRYLESRGLVGADLLDTFRIGTADGTLLRVVAAGQGKEPTNTRALLRKLGILRESGREHLTGCVVFPLFSYDGVPESLYGRRVADRGPVKHMYLSGPRRGLFNPDAFKQSQLVLCESVIDALTFYAHGVRNVSCTYGTEGFTDEMLEAMERGGVKRVLIAFDADRPGNEAAVRLSARLRAEGIETRRVLFPMNTDANEYARAVDGPAEALRALIQDARPVEPEESQVSAPSAIEETPSKQLRPSPSAASPEQIEGDEIRIMYAERSYRVRGLFKNTSDHIMKINLRAQRGDAYHLDTLDLLSARARQNFIAQASEELHVSADLLKHDLGRLLGRLEELQSDRLQRTLKERDAEPEIPRERREKALAYLKDPNLIRNIVRDFERAGLVGERTNALLGYLGTVSRRTEAPLAIIIQSSSSAGKSALMEAVLDMVPEEDRIKFSMMTGQSLYYMQSRDLRHKIIAISEEEGVERAKYAIKILQSEGKITIATTVKDPTTGLPDTQEFSVEGPVMFLLTTTNVEIDEELQNRCLVITINESREQTGRIQKMQRDKRTLEGILQKRSATGLAELHQDAQRLLRPIAVSISHANRIVFPDTKLRLRRDQEKFLTLIESIALLHQHQREIRSRRDVLGDLEYIEASDTDVALAAWIYARVFGTCLDDLSPQTRRLLEETERFVSEECTAQHLERRQFRFTRRQLREYTGWGNTRLGKHLDRLVELEYVLCYGAGQGKLAEYELLYDGHGTDGDPFIAGLTGGSELDPGLAEFLLGEPNLSPPGANLTPQSANLSPRVHPENTPFSPAVPFSSNAKFPVPPVNGRSSRDFSLTARKTQI